MPLDGGFDYNYVLAQELNPKPENLSLIDEGKVWVGVHAALNIVGNASERTPLTEELQQFIPIAKRYHEDRLADCADIAPDSIKWVDIYQLPGGLKEGGVGSRDLGFMRIADLPIHSKSLKDFQQAVILVHELGHGVAPIKLHYQGEGKFAIDRGGMAYPVRKQEDMGINSALEEGLVVRSQIGAMDLVRQHFPKGAENYDKIVESLKKRGYFDDKREMVMIVETTEDGHWGIIKQSTDCVKLVEYLIEEIPDFERLVERARIKHETLALARAVQKRFWRGAYKRLVLARDPQSLETLEWLKGGQKGVGV